MISNLFEKSGLVATEKENRVKIKQVYGRKVIGKRDLERVNEKKQKHSV